MRWPDGCAIDVEFLTRNHKPLRALWCFARLAGAQEECIRIANFNAHLFRLMQR
jgi:hypothetical protein